MERIDLFDKYIKGQLTAEETRYFNKEIVNNNSFAEAFEVYKLIVKGIRKEAEAETIEFSIAMKSLSKDQLIEIIGKKSQPLDKESIVEILKLHRQSIFGPSQELSSMAALVDGEDENSVEMPSSPMEDEKNGKDNGSKVVENGSSLRKWTVIFILVIILSFILLLVI